MSERAAGDNELAAIRETWRFDFTRDEGTKLFVDTSAYNALARLAQESVAALLARCDALMADAARAAPVLEAVRAHMEGYDARCHCQACADDQATKLAAAYAVWRAANNGTKEERDERRTGGNARPASPGQ